MRSLAVGRWVFVSHASEDRTAAEAIVEHLERRGIRCWIAPRDVASQPRYARQIVHAINASGVFLLLLCQHACRSEHVTREVDRAVHYGVPIVVVRIDDTDPSDELEYYLAGQHWLDGSRGLSEEALEALTAEVRKLISPARRVSEQTSQSVEFPVREVSETFACHIENTANAFAKHVLERDRAAMRPGEQP